MNSLQLEVRELAAWGFDLEPDRGLLSGDDLRQVGCKAQFSLASHDPYMEESPISAEETRRASALLRGRVPSIAASGEFDGLGWELAMVDLSKLIAFQRRIGFAIDEQVDMGRLVNPDEILEFALPLARPSAPARTSASADGSRLTIRTRSPNLTLRFGAVSEQYLNGDLYGVRLFALTGSPYIEVASYRGRWFLRDGYHRSFRLLSQGIRCTPAVVVYAKTVTQLGAVKAKFFAEDILFSARPPMVADFLEDDLTVQYLREERQRVFHISIEEQPARVFAQGCQEEYS